MQTRISTVMCHFNVFVNGNTDCPIAKQIVFTEALLPANWDEAACNAIRRSLESGGWERAGNVKLKAVRIG